jgi:hypothetical protein
MLFSRAGRDDPDDFFATIVLPVHMNNQQHGSGPGFNPNCANRMPALFFRLAVDAVRLDEAAFVLEHQRRQFKRDSVVFPLVPKVLRFIPFVAHRVYT